MEVIPFFKERKHGSVILPFEWKDIMRLCKTFGNPAVKEAIRIWSAGGYRKFGNIEAHLNPNESFRMTEHSGQFKAAPTVDHSKGW